MKTYKGKVQVLYFYSDTCIFTKVHYMIRYQLTQTNNEITEFGLNINCYINNKWNFNTKSIRVIDNLETKDDFCPICFSVLRGASLSA